MVTGITAYKGRSLHIVYVAFSRFHGYAVNNIGIICFD